MSSVMFSRMWGTIPLLLIVSSFCPDIYGKVIYVDDDATGTNNGSRWENAYVYLQDALADANNSDKPVEIRVAQGIYRPDLGGGNVPGDREAAFELINGVTLAGGYAGIDANDPNTHDIELYETILSGDLKGDDVERSIEEYEDYGWVATRAENSYHVLVGSGTNVTAVLDGFAISGGCADGPELDSDPFDMYRLQRGGGMYNYEGSPTLTNCTFIGNSANDGAGIYNKGGSLILTNCAFSGNEAMGGGGMLNEEGTLILNNCTFSNNLGFGGGGIVNDQGSSILTNCTFSRNSDGAVWNSRGSVALSDCTFSGNTRCVSNHGGNMTLTNCIFSGNYMGVILSWDDPNSGSILTNCTFSGNHNDFGGVISYQGDDPNSGPVLTNCILWDNAPNEIPQTSTVTYSNIQGGWAGDGNISEDPLFANPGYWADVNDPNIVVDEPDFWNSIWVEGDYHLKSQAGRFDPTTQSWTEDDVTSPCIDAGDPFSPVMYEPHPHGCIINMGAYGGTEQASKSPTCQ
jgi:hypothetical protein